MLPASETATSQVGGASPGDYDTPNPLYECTYTEMESSGKDQNTKVHGEGVAREVHPTDQYTSIDTKKMDTPGNYEQI